uniref:Uncharacterized protein n=1 Tax=Cyanistes caeruleus TaxID=156563 RepID=A0A8C0ZD76_CYACU
MRHCDCTKASFLCLTKPDNQKIREGSRENKHTLPYLIVMNRLRRITAFKDQVVGNIKRGYIPTRHPQHQTGETEAKGCFPRCCQHPCMSAMHKFN